MLFALLFFSTFSLTITIISALLTTDSLIQQEKHIMALKDSVANLTSAVAANTTAVAAIPSASDVATAVTAIDAATAQVTTNNTTLAGDVAAPPVA